MPQYTVIRHYSTTEMVTVEGKDPTDAYQVALEKFEGGDSVDFYKCWDGTEVYDVADKNLETVLYEEG